ncbi:hypothetical protein K504DRAFT_142225 [Pleomassaria siparia CBS 279.74]|uniref:Uncharacterized protein n=1 Tax=Pleomassaria siparia CBS 279.74 TaxID=1314801 RepID=A0A6G1KLD2_9PLEO|nr:hypothetical protein K504DRAFT_142225 [Pleomassaria siparia CBS 279.74]
MDSAIMSTRPHPSISTSGLSTTRQRKFTGSRLNAHGMPKPPLSSPSARSFHAHRFSNRQSPSLASPPLSPMSPMSPTGTLIDSAPSTPAWSPRSEASTWDSNTLLVLSPVSSAPSSPNPSFPEPTWEMVSPAMPAQMPFPPSHHVHQSNSMSSSDARSLMHRGHHIVWEPQTATTPPPEEMADTAPEAKDSGGESTHTLALGKFATKVRSIWRRKPASEKKSSKTKKRRRVYEDLDRLEDVHWTEM